MKEKQQKTLRHLTKAVAALCAVTLLATGCTKTVEKQVEKASTPHGIQLPPEGNLESFASQTPKWEDCGADAKCADIYAPQDWSNLKGATISLHISKLPATGKKQGTIFFNFGGPGGPGAELLPDYANSDIYRALRKSYDLVSWDPRGTGSSTSINCLSDTQLDQVVYGSAGVDSTLEFGSEDWYKAARKYANRYYSSCRSNTGTLLDNVDTLSTVKDLDMLRAILGEEKLNYAGFSYGTLLGQEYAAAYPENTGRMLLDGVLTTTAGINELTVMQAKGFQAALDAYIESCLQEESCPLTGTREEAIAELTSEQATLATDPAPTESGRFVTEHAFTNALLAGTSAEDWWPYLSVALSEYFKGNPEKILELSDEYVERGEKRYENNMLEAYFVIMCDDSGRVDNSYEDAHALADEAKNVSAVFAKQLTTDALVCSSWPAKAKRDFEPVKPELETPILLVGTTGDPATPYEWAQQAHEYLPSSRLLTYEAFTHVAFSRSTCASEAAAKYFFTGQLPEEGTVCTE